MFTRLLSFFKNSDFEVSLAVSISKTDADEPTEEQQEIYDSFFSSLGFEYINGHMLDHGSPLRHGGSFDGKIVNATCSSCLHRYLLIVKVSRVWDE